VVFDSIGRHFSRFFRQEQTGNDGMTAINGELRAVVP
jgi:hypothetical protein